MGILKTSTSISLFSTWQVFGPLLPGCGGEAGSLVDFLVHTWLTRGGGLTHALGVNRPGCTSECVSTGAAHIGAYMWVMWTGSTRMAPVAFGLGRLPSHAIPAALWIAWVCKGAHAVTSRFRMTLQGTVQRGALQP